VFAVAALPARAQTRDWTVEVRPFAGVYLPVGAQRADFKSATMVGMQGAVELTRHVHALATLGWTHGHNKFFAGDLTHIWQYDVGAEFNLVREMAGGWLFRPFVGGGAGARTIDYRGDAARTTTCAAGYGTLGGEIEMGVVAVRAEARDYLACFESPVTERTRTRNDLALSVGFAYHIR
jgi:hypothetical protein